MKTIIKKNYQAVSKEAARIIATQIITDPQSVLGLPTGSTPTRTYENLVRLHKVGILDFSQVVTFNLDEYFNLPEDHEQSFHYYMEKRLFLQVNLKEENTYLPDGQASNPQKECRRYENLIQENGGIDLMVLGLGPNGHIGFNEPGTNWDSQTRLIKLTDETKERNFDDLKDAPDRAITMGIKTIMRSRKIILLASGEEKAKALEKTVHGPIAESWPGSILQLHPNITAIAEQEAASDI